MLEVGGTIPYKLIAKKNHTRLSLKKKLPLIPSISVFKIVLFPTALTSGLIYKANILWLASVLSKEEAEIIVALDVLLYEEYAVK